MYQKLSFLLVILLSSASISANQKAAELDCACDKVSWQQSFDNAQHVVFGEVKNVKRHGDELATGDFIPIEVFKGVETHVTKLAGSGKTGVSCRRVLRDGFYIAYAGESHSVVLNNCSSSRQLREADDLVPVLTELKKYAESQNPAYAAQHGSSSQVKQSAATQKTNKEGSKWWVVLLLVASLLVTIMVVVKMVLPRLNK